MLDVNGTKEERMEVYKSLFEMLQVIETTHPDMADLTASIGMGIDFVLGA